MATLTLSISRVFMVLKLYGMFFLRWQGLFSEGIKASVFSRGENLQLMTATELKKTSGHCSLS